MARPFGATNEPGTCPWCGRKYQIEKQWNTYPATEQEIAEAKRKMAKIRELENDHRTYQDTMRMRNSIHTYESPSEPGKWITRKLESTGKLKPLYGGLFDTLQCAERFASHAHAHGFRLKPKRG